MFVEMIALCDAATDHGGRLNLLGVFDRVGGALPIVLPQCAVVARVRWDREDAGEHQVGIQLVDESGKQLIPPLDSKLNVPPMPPELDSHAVNMILNLQRLHIEKAGVYKLTMTINNEVMAKVPLFVQDTTPREPNPLAPNSPWRDKIN